MKLSACLKVCVPLLLSIGATLANAACVPVIGTARMMPDTTCSIRSVAQPGVPAESFQSECFSSQLSLAGFPTATGFSGNTSELLVSLANNAPATMSPVVLPSPTSQLPHHMIQTARSSMVLGVGARATRIYTNDVVIIQPTITSEGKVVPKVMTEQITIAGTDGKGAFANVTGYLHLMGTSVGALSAVAGQICMP